MNQCHKAPSIYVVTNIDPPGPFTHEEFLRLEEAEYRKGFLEAKYRGSRVTITRLSGKDRRLVPDRQPIGNPIKARRA